MTPKVSIASTAFSDAPVPTGTTVAPICSSASRIGSPPTNRPSPAALGDVVVGVAEPGGVEPDPHLVRLGLVEGQIGDLPAAVRGAGDPGAGGGGHR